MNHVQDKAGLPDSNWGCFDDYRLHKKTNAYAPN